MNTEKMFLFVSKMLTSSVLNGMKDYNRLIKTKTSCIKFQTSYHQNLILKCV